MFLLPVPGVHRVDPRVRHLRGRVRVRCDGWGDGRANRASATRARTSSGVGGSFELDARRRRVGEVRGRIARGADAGRGRTLRRRARRVEKPASLSSRGRGKKARDGRVGARTRHPARLPRDGALGHRADAAQVARQRSGGSEDTGHGFARRACEARVTVARARAPLRSTSRGSSLRSRPSSWLDLAETSGAKIISLARPLGSLQRRRRSVRPRTRSS